MNKIDPKKNKVGKSTQNFKEEDKNIIAGYAAGKLATAALVGAAIHTIYNDDSDKIDIDDTNSNVFSSSDILEMRNEDLSGDLNNENSDVEENEDYAQETNTDFSEEDNVVELTHSMIESSEITNEEVAAKEHDISSMADASFFENSNTTFHDNASIDGDILVESIVIDENSQIEESSKVEFDVMLEPESYDADLNAEVSDVVPEVLAEDSQELIPDLEFEEYTDLNDEVSEVTSEVLAEDSQELIPDLEFEEYTDLNEEISEVSSEVLTETPQELMADIEFEEYVDSDDEYDSVAALFDEEDESDYLSFNDNLEASRSAEDFGIDDETELSDFENDADVNSFM